MKRLLLAILILMLTIPVTALTMLFASTAFADCPGLHGTDLSACEHIQWASAGTALLIGSVVSALLIRVVLIGRQ